MLERGIIVSIQGYHQKTIEELAKNAINAGAVAIRTDKPIHFSPYEKKVPLIGLNKSKVVNPEITPYITPDLESIISVSKWAEYIAIDYRQLNPNLKKISDYCKEQKLNIVADIGSWKDFNNIKENDYYYTYIATSFSVFDIMFFPDKELLSKVCKIEKNVIAEGNYKTRKDVKEALEIGACNVCIGGAISDVYKLTRKFTTVSYAVRN